MPTCAAGFDESFEWPSRSELANPAGYSKSIDLEPLRNSRMSDVWIPDASAGRTYEWGLANPLDSMSVLQHE